MIGTYIHNNSYVKRVDDLTNLFQYNHTLTQGFPDLPSGAIEVDDVVVDQYTGFEDRAFMHHSTLGKKYGKLYASYSIHYRDEDASGMYTNLSVSSDNGVTWSNLGAICPSMSDMALYGTYPAQWSYPSAFLCLPSGFYLLINCVDGIVNVTDYQPLGTLVRKINPDNTFGELLWVNNGNGNDRTPPTPLAGYPSYNFASEELIEEVFTYITQDMHRPKILFGWSEVWSAQENYFADPSNKLREPTEIKPYNYFETLKVWKSSGFNFNMVQIGEDNSTQTVSEIPNDSNSTAKRFYNYSPEIIVSVGHTANSSRTELGLLIWRKDNNTGRYVLNNGDAYSITDLAKSAPVHVGHNKSGAEQLPFIVRERNLLHVVFSVSKEEIFYKRINIETLI